ncbi:MAG: glycosyltransferase, partial [Pseudomonadales bacterium]
MNEKKILYCIDGLVRGGTELQLVELIKRLDKTKYEPHLLTIRETDKALVPRECRHIEWTVPSLMSPRGLLFLIHLVRILRREKIDIVQTFFQDSTIFSGTAAKIAGVPVRIASCRDMAFWSSSFEGRLMKLAYRQMTGFICNANAVRDHFCQTFGIDPLKTTVIYNGVDQSLLPVNEFKATVTDIGIVGNMTRQVKRTDLFIKAAAIVAKKYPAIRWHIVGDGQLRPELEKLAESFGVKQQFIFAGRVDDVSSFLEKLQIGVICS